VKQSSPCDTARSTCPNNLSIHGYGETSCGVLSRRAETDGLA
jgi:hypothetical protein